MKKILPYLVFISIPFLTNAQEVIWEINGNIGRSTLPIQNDQEDYDFILGAELEPTNNITYSLGSSVGIQLIPKLYFHAGLNIMQLRATEEAVNVFDIGEDITYTLNYNSYFFTSPFYLKFKYKQLGIYAGGLGLYFLKGDTDYKVTFEEESITSEDDDFWNNNLELQDFSFGYLLGLSIDFPPSSFGLRLEYHNGVSNVAKAKGSIFEGVENYTRHTQFVTLGLVYIIP